MTRVTIGLTLAGLIVLFIAYAKGVGVIHGGDVLSHMYWATGALPLVALANFIAVAQYMWLSTSPPCITPTPFA